MAKRHGSDVKNKLNRALGGFGVHDPSRAHRGDLKQRPLMPREIFGGRNITGNPLRKTFFGTGSHYYPQSRASVGIWILHEWAARNHLTWDVEYDIYCAIAENEKCAMVRPEVFILEHNGKALAQAALELNTTLDRVVVIHAEEKMPLGTCQLVFGGSARHNPCLESIRLELNTERFPRMIVGVGHPEWKAVQGRYLPTYDLGEHDYTERFLKNKFPPKEMEMVERFLMKKYFEVMDIAMKASSAEDFNFQFTVDFEQMRAGVQLGLSDEDFPSIYSEDSRKGKFRLHGQLNNNSSNY